MNRTVLFLVFCLTAVMHSERSEAAGPWNGKSAAVVLSYDDGLNVHLDTVVPLLNQHDIRATFFINGTAASVAKRSDDWRIAAVNGHELGNHTMKHPCSAGLPGREWVKPEKDLDRYTTSQFSDEIAQANTLLHSIDNKQRRTFAYPCGDKIVEGQSIVGVIENVAVAARGVNGGINKPGQINLYDLLAYSVYGQDAELLIQEVAKAVSNNGLLVFLFHGVGGEHGLNIDRDEHRKFIEYLASSKDELWIAPLVDVADYVVENDLVAR